MDVFGGGGVREWKSNQAHGAVLNRRITNALSKKLSISARVKKHKAEDWPSASSSPFVVDKVCTDCSKNWFTRA